MTNPKPCGQIQHQHHLLGNVLYCLVLLRYVALRDDWMISALGSYLKHGSSVAILIVIIDESVPSKLRAFLVSVLFSPIAENRGGSRNFEKGGGVDLRQQCRSMIVMGVGYERAKRARENMPLSISFSVHFCTGPKFGNMFITPV